MYACALTLKLYVCLLAYIVKKKFFMLPFFRWRGLLKVINFGVHFQVGSC